MELCPGDVNHILGIKREAYKLFNVHFKRTEKSSSTFFRFHRTNGILILASAQQRNKLKNLQNDRERNMGMIWRKGYMQD